MRHLRDKFTSQDELKRSARREPETGRPAREEIPCEVRDKLTTEIMERHYAAWPDTPLTALDGETPRQAARTPAGRRRLDALLRDFENLEEHKRQAGEPYYPVSRLRAALGLPE